MVKSKDADRTHPVPILLKLRYKIGCQLETTRTSLQRVLQFYLTTAAAVFFVLAASSCHDQSISKNRSSIDNQPTVSIPTTSAENNEIRIATRNAPTTYFIDRDGNRAGFEYELASTFAKNLGLKPIFKEYDTVDDIINALLDGEVHFAAAGLAKTLDRQLLFNFGPVYKRVDEIVVCKKDKRVNDLEDLVDRSIVFTSNGSYEESLRALRKKIPRLKWLAIDNKSSEELLEEVNSGIFDCMIVDSNIYQLSQHLYESVVQGPVVDQSELAWPINPDFPLLKKDMSLWFNSDFHQEYVEILRERYYGSLGNYDNYDMHVFKRRIRTRLPKYRKLLAEAAEKTGLHIRLLAAVSYQESHWNPLSRSPTGVRGFMMLTLPTAKSLGVTNRIDARQSIMAGARYLRRLIRRFPSFISPADRQWMGLAAYNVGYYHVQDARRLAIELRKNPNSWKDLKTVLPLLSNKKYYKKTRYGYARGQEPVTYVRNIRNYEKVLNSLMILKPNERLESSH